MHLRRISIILLVAGVLLVVVTGLWLATAQPVGAQCGSSASSCKNCHEVQAEMPVNSDGTAWHQPHAFGDFCYICHAGNNQAMDLSEAHTGLVAPLSDLQASCAQCHPGDLDARAQVYADVLGIEAGSGTALPISTSLPEPAASPSVEALFSVPAANALAVDDPNLVDYVRRYDEIVLGKRPVNWGNVVLIGMIAMLLAGGGGFVIWNEKWVTLSFGEMKEVGAEFPAEVVDMLPSLVRLKPKARRSMKKILDHPGTSEKVLGLIDEIVSTQKDEE